MINIEQAKEVTWTGGPCSGKSTGIQLVRQKIEDKGFKVFVRDEIATRFIEAGITPWDENWNNKEFQRHLILHTIETDERFRKIVNSISSDKKLIMYDRGIFDSLAYVSRETFNDILREEKLDYGHLMGLTDMVLALQTAAYGAEKFYTTLNNKARKESPAEARTLDDLVKEGWVGHEHISVITNDNGKTFDQKMYETYQRICEFLGIPVPIESERKFLVEVGNIDMHHCNVDISQTYLRTNDESEERVRRRTIENSSTFYWTKKLDIPGSTDRNEIQRRISEREYYLFIENFRDPNYMTVKKTRTCFLYKNQYFELDNFIDPKAKEPQLEWEGTDSNHILEFPSFIKVIKEVTGDKQYSNKQRALIRA